MSITRWIASPSAFGSQVGDDLALMSQKTSTYYTMNKTGSFVWSMLQTAVTQAAIVEALHEKYDVELALCERDVEVLFAELEFAKLIEDASDTRVNLFHVGAINVATDASSSITFLGPCANSTVETSGTPRIGITLSIRAIKACDSLLTSSTLP